MNYNPKITKLSVIVPCFNEINNIAEIIERINKVELPGLEREIIVVDDCSTDGTQDFLRSIQGIQVIFHDRNKGKGAAVKTGFNHATGDILIIQDADLEYDPEDYKRLIDPIKRGEAEVVIGSRFQKYLPKFLTKNNDPFMSHFIGNLAIIWTTNFLYRKKMTDYEGCYKAFTKKIIDSIPIEANSFEYDNELICKIFRLGFDVLEVPISYHPRSYKDGKKINWRHGLVMLWTILRWRIKKIEFLPDNYSAKISKSKILQAKAMTSVMTEAAKEDLPPVCLIIPPSPFLLDERVFMSLGILKIAAVLEKSGYPVQVLDLSGVRNYEDVVAEYLQNTYVNMFGITSTTPQMPAVKQIAQTIRKYKHGSRLILGGPHGTLVHAARRREIKNNQHGRGSSAIVKLLNLFDVIVVGDGEEAIKIALGDSPPRIIDGDDPSGPFFLTREKLNQMPFPARHLVDIDSYHYSIENIQATNLIGQLGCPFGCGFCGGRKAPSLRRARIRNHESIEKEILQLYETYGFRGFMFYDDELNVNCNLPNLMNHLTEMQHRLNTIFRFRGFIKSELFNDAQAESMVKAGFRWILVGFESGSPRILTNINKRASVEDNTRCMEIARRHGLKVKALMSLGHPGESKETILQTKEWLLKVKPDDFDVSIITVYPGTPYFDEAIPVSDKNNVCAYVFPKTGDSLYSYDIDYTETADYYKGIPNTGYNAFVYTDYISSEDIVKKRDEMEEEVRAILKIPFNPGAPGINYEHSMGQQNALPQNILRSSNWPGTVERKQQLQQTY